MMMIRLLFLLSTTALLPTTCQAAAAAAGFFIQGASLTWYHPKSNAVSVSDRRTRSIQQPVSKKQKAAQDVYQILEASTVVDPSSGQRCQAMDDGFFLGNRNRNNNPFDYLNLFGNKKKKLIVVMPQLGDQASCEYAELLLNILPDLQKANIALRIIGIGNAKSAQMFSLFTGLPLDCIRVDPTASLHQSLKLHRGPDWDIPNWIPSPFIDWFAKEVCKSNNDKIDPTQVLRAWLNYMAMCAGISAPGSLQETFRGLWGDRTAPERLWSGEKVRAGPVTIQGTSHFQLGPFKTKSLWKNKQGHLRPAELATIRLRSMSEVWTKFDHYVPDQRMVDWRGATFLLEEPSKSSSNSNSNSRMSDQRQQLGKPLTSLRLPAAAKTTTTTKPLYEYRDKGPLMYSKTMDRPLSFLSNFIGLQRARNPTGLQDPEFIYDYDDEAELAYD